MLSEVVKQTNGRKMAQTQQLGTIRVRGNVVMSRLIKAQDNAYGNRSYVLGLSKPVFENDVSMYPNPQQMQLAIDAIRQRVKPASQDHPDTTLWLNVPEQSLKGQPNHITYLDKANKMQIPTKNDIAKGTTVTALISVYQSDAPTLAKYNGIAGRLEGVLFDKVDDTTWYNPQENRLGLSGFKMLSDDEAFGEAPTNTNVEVPAQDPFSNGNGQTAPQQPANPFSNGNGQATPQQPANPFSNGNGQTAPQQPANPFSNGNGQTAPQQPANPFSNGNGQTAPQQPANPFSNGNGQVNNPFSNQ